MGAAGFVANKIMENVISKFKQETLEEAAERIAYDSTEENKGFPSIKMFIKGGNWQAERMYSEGDKIMKFLDDEKNLGISDKKTIERIKWYFETYFEQFKNKQD